MSQQQPQQQAPRWESRFEKAIYHLDQAMKHMSAFMDELSKENFEMQKGMDFLKWRRDLLVNAVEKSGGEVTSLSQDMQEYIPSRYRRPANGGNGEDEAQAEVQASA